MNPGKKTSKPFSLAALSALCWSDKSRPSSMPSGAVFELKRKILRKLTQKIRYASERN